MDQAAFVQAVQQAVRDGITTEVGALQARLDALERARVDAAPRVRFAQHDGDQVAGYEGYQKQVQGILTVGEEGEIVIEPKMREWLESIECTAEGDA